jgi:hypothetical protein
MVKCIRCGAVKLPLSENFAGRDGVPGDRNTHFICFRCAPIVRREVVEELSRQRIEELRQLNLVEEERLAKRKAKHAELEKFKNLALSNPTRLNLTLASGACYQISHVMLYHGPTIKRARELQTEAHKNFGGVSTGLGFWGSPGWVLGGALALGLLESAASESAAQRGFQQLHEVEEIMHKTREQGQFVAVACIENLHYPTPALWRSVAVKPEQELDDISDGKQAETYLIHNGEPFVQMKTASGQALYIAWDKVEQYSVVDMGKDGGTSK